jgi:hypothetical protein
MKELVTWKSPVDRAINNSILKDSITSLNISTTQYPEASLKYLISKYLEEGNEVEMHVTKPMNMS